MRVIVMKEPQIVDVNGRSGRSFTGVDENGQTVRVTISPGDGLLSETLQIDVESVAMPKVGVKP